MTHEQSKTDGDGCGAEGVATTMTDTLLPCPWCNAEAICRFQPQRLPHRPHGFWRVLCNDDQCLIGPHGDFETEAEAIAAWNRRASPASSAWRPIETAPKDGTAVRLYHTDDGYLDVCGQWTFASFRTGLWTILSRFSCVYDEGGTEPLGYLATHWKPLGEPPSKAESGDAGSIGGGSAASVANPPLGKPGEDVVEALEREIARFEADERVLYPDHEVLESFDRLRAALSLPSVGDRDGALEAAASIIDDHYWDSTGEVGKAHGTSLAKMIRALKSPQPQGEGRGSLAKTRGPLVQNGDGGS